MSFSKIILVLILTLPSPQKGITTTDASYLPKNTDTAAQLLKTITTCLTGQPVEEIFSVHLLLDA